MSPERRGEGLACPPDWLAPARPHPTSPHPWAHTPQRCKFTPVRPTSQLIPAAYDITLNFDRTGGLLMEVEPRRRA